MKKLKFTNRVQHLDHQSKLKLYSVFDFCMYQRTVDETVLPAAEFFASTSFGCDGGARISKEVDEQETKDDPFLRTRRSWWNLRLQLPNQ